MVVTPECIPLTSVTYSEEDESYRAKYDSERTTPAMAVVATVASVREVPPETIQPIHDSLAADALNEVVADAVTDPVAVDFSFGGYDITVSSDGFVDLSHPDR